MPGKIVRNFQGVFLVNVLILDLQRDLFFSILPLTKLDDILFFFLTIPERIGNKSYAQVVGKTNIFWRKSVSQRIPMGLLIGRALLNRPQLTNWR